MSLHLNRFRITARIYVGFGLLVALGLALALLGGWQFSVTGTQVSTLVTGSDQTARVLQGDHLLETMRRAALRYQTKGDQAMLKEFAEARSGASELLAQSVKAAMSDERGRQYQQAADLVATFKSDFDQLVALSNKAIEGNQKLAKSGVDLVGTVSKAVEMGRTLTDEDGKAAMHQLEVAVLSARLGSARFNVFKTSEFLDQAHVAAVEANKAFAAAEQAVRDEAVRTQVGAAK